MKYKIPELPDNLIYEIYYKFQVKNTGTTLAMNF